MVTTTSIISYNALLSSQELVLDTPAYTAPQCSMAVSTNGTVSDRRSGDFTKRSAQTNFPTAKLLIELILYITGIDKPKIINLLNRTLTKKSQELQPLLTNLCRFASEHACPSCVDSRPVPKTVLDSRIRLSHSETWRGFKLPVISVSNSGRLGNLMSEYSTIFALNKIYNVSTVLLPPFSKLLHKYFTGISLPTIEGSEKNEWKTLTGEFRQKRSCKTLQLAAAGLLGPTPVMFADFLMDMSLVNAFKEEVRQEFTFHKSTLEKATARLQDVKKMVQLDDKNERMTVVGVHVRLTDYQNHMNKMYKVYNITSSYEDYLRRAVGSFTSQFPNSVFLVTSDNAKQTQDMFKRFTLRNVFVMKGTADEDMCLLTLCDHNIITFGTFGFWAGYLGRGITIYPDLNDPKIEYPTSRPFYEKAQINTFVPVLFR
ncbi:Glycosyl transferase family 11 [Trinorchestia longiramus]|nr:Glycosyl transferase family 11 [Trinorchestia longiramus]